MTQPGFILGLLCLGRLALPPNRPEPPVHRERNRRTNHTGHNQKQQAKSEYRIGKVQRTNCGTPTTNKAHAARPMRLMFNWKRRLARLQGGFGRDSIGGNTNYIFTQYYIFAEAICNGTRAAKGDLSGCVRPKERSGPS